MRQPAIYIPHGGGPCFFMDWEPADMWDSMAAYLRSIQDSLPGKPAAIVVVSAHWLTDDFCVQSAAKPAMLYDYYGFPPHTYELQYPAAGVPQLAAEIQTQLMNAGFQAGLDAERGFDHGVFVPLLLAFPEADIPVIQLSLKNNLSPTEHIACGRILENLRDRNVLIIGSGMSFHNMRAFGDPRAGDYADAFDQALTAACEAEPAERNARLDDWESMPAARFCHPPSAEEHLLPLMVCAGAAGQDRGRKVFSDLALRARVSAFHFG